MAAASKSQAKPVSVWVYVLVSAAALLISVGLLLIYIRELPVLVQNGMRDYIYWLLLSVWAIFPTVFCVGVMGTVATFQHKGKDWSLSLRGSAVVYFVFLVLPYKFVPHPPQTFDLTVRAHSEDGSEPLITKGQVTIDFGTDRRSAAFDLSGEVNFKKIPQEFKMATVTVLPDVDGYERTRQQIKIVSDVIDLSLVREKEQHTLLTGTVIPLPAKRSHLTVVVEGQESKAEVDDAGRFELNVTGRPGDQVRLQVYSDRKVVYDDYQVLPGPVNIKLNAVQ